MWLLMWDMENIRKIEEHGFTQDEVDELINRCPTVVWKTSRRSGRPLAIGWISTGVLLGVPVDVIDDDHLRPVTAFDAEGDEHDDEN